jgi:hypothetical protein
VAPQRDKLYESTESFGFYESHRDEVAVIEEEVDSHHDSGGQSDIITGVFSKPVATATTVLGQSLESSNRSVDLLP